MRSLRAPPCLLLLTLVLASSASAQSGVDSWLQARAREQSAWLAAPPERATGTAGPLGLWRERAAGEPGLPNFVPPTSLSP